ncbi:hypothetical protein Ocin01_07169 [Orchesella cincta]|uniref:Uncharacterized protein n=1 Tax=Orchesella cincta TaxID=48709 RepID=A0A1D2N2H9_ORCCI|nr:hypothetical protein Ocin01_07169 [Orchesella cincta]
MHNSLNKVLTELCEINAVFLIRDQKIENVAVTTTRKQNIPNQANSRSGEASDEQDHQSECSHACAYDHKCQLNWLQPLHLEMEDIREHQPCESDSPIHCAAKDSHSSKAHDGRYQGSVRNSDIRQLGDRCRIRVTVADS